MDTLRATPECNFPSHSQGPNSMHSWFTPLLCLYVLPPSALLMQPQPSWLRRRRGCEAPVSPVPLHWLRVGVFLSCRQWQQMWSPTSQSSSSSIVGHTAGLHRQMEKKRLDHCLFSLIFIMPLLFLPLITSNRKVPLRSPTLQLLV